MNCKLKINLLMNQLRIGSEEIFRIHCINVNYKDKLNNP